MPASLLECGDSSPLLLPARNVQSPQFDSLRLTPSSKQLSRVAATYLEYHAARFLKPAQLGYNVLVESSLDIQAAQRIRQLDCMNIKMLFPRGSKALLLPGAVLITAALALGAYFALQRPSRVAMTRYVPASSLAFAEVYNLGDVVDGLTSTKAWTELAPVLGLSSQLREIGPLVSLFGRTGLGPDEAVIAGRAQFGLAVTGLESDTGASEEGPYIHFKPHFALVVETHSSPAVAGRIAGDKVAIVARRLFGDSAVEERDAYQGIELHTFHGPDSARQLLAASTGSLLLIGNDRSSVESCLDAIAGRVQTLADDEVLSNSRSVVDGEAAIFGYLTAAGIDKLSAIGPALFSSRFTTDPERIDAIANLFRHISGQALSGFLYGAQFTSDGVTDRYLAVVNPLIASGMNDAFRPSATQPDGDCLRLVPRSAEDFTVINMEGLGGVPQRALKRISPGLDVVGGLALREFVIGFFSHLGVSPDLAQDTLGDHMVLVKFNQSEIATITQVKDSKSVAPYIQGYLGYRGAGVKTESYKGVEISLSSAEDERAAALDGNYLLMGRAARIRQMIDARDGARPFDQSHPGGLTLCNGSAGSVGQDQALMRALNVISTGAPIITCNPCPEDAARLMLAISTLTRTTDGSPEILERDEARRAVERLPASVSVTEFRDIGVYTETRSAIGNLGLIVTLGSED